MSRVFPQYPAFSDVGRNSPYFADVEWALTSGITNGMGNGLFAPDSSLSREQAFTFLYRTMVYTGEAPKYGAGHEYLKQATEFDDYLQMSSRAANPVQLLLDIGIVTGSDTNCLWPQQVVNNAVAATIGCKAMAYMGVIAAG